MHMNEHGITLRHGKHKGRLIRSAGTLAKTIAAMARALHQCHLQ